MGKFLVSLKGLEQWFHRQKRVLPWRDDPTVYRVWISEVMLQQTQVITVVPYFEKFTHRFSSVEVLAAAPEEDVLLHWAGLGYYSRARNLHRGAKKIVETGHFPRNREEWLEIPGVGNYTAGAILSISEDRPEAILDGNVERVLSRVRRVSRQQGDVAFKERLWKVSRIFVEKANLHGIKPSVLNQALMELGATVCSPKKPQCENCPLSSVCRARQHQDPLSYPPKKKPKEWVQIEEKLHCIVSSSGKVLVRQRKKGEWRAGLWDLLEKTPIEYSSAVQFVGEVETRHVVTRHKIRRLTQVWKLNQPEGQGAQLSLWKAAEPHQEGLKWINPESPDVAVGSALKRTLRQICERSD